MSNVRKRISIDAKVDLSSYDYMLRHKVTCPVTGRKFNIAHHNAHLGEVVVSAPSKKKMSTYAYFMAMENLLSKPKEMERTDKIYRRVFGVSWLRRRMASSIWAAVAACEMEFKKSILDRGIRRSIGV